MRYSVEFAKKLFGNKPIIAAEVGVWQGGFSKEIYSNFNIKDLYLIDSWSLEYRKEAIESLHKVIDLFKYNQNVHIFKITSEEASKVLNIKFDYVYLDNLHNPDYVFKEMTWWFPKIKNGGILAGHDYSSNRPDRVKKAVIKFCKKYKLEYSAVEYNPKEEVGDWVIIK